MDASAALPNLGVPWAIPWPCIHEFLAIVTHPRIYDPPTPLGDALGAGRLLDGGADPWRSWAEATGYWPELRETLDLSRVRRASAFTMRGSSRFAGSTA